MGTRALLVLASILLIAGCGSVTILHPISAQDIFVLKKGESVQAPKDGYFLSNEYLAEVAKAKVR